MKLTYLGHSCFSIETKGKTILIDPFISANPLAKDVRIDDLNPDYILLTHGHEDHVLDAEKILKQTNALLVASYEVVVWYSKKGISNAHPMNTGGSKSFDFGKVKCVNAVHSSCMPDGSYGGPAMGFVIESEEANVYIAGDTALTWDMKLIPEICAPLDIAILPIGNNFTMDAQDAVRAAEFCKAPKVVGCHYDTFGYIEIDQGSTSKIFSKANIELMLPKIGETILL